MTKGYAQAADKAEVQNMSTAQLEQWAKGVFRGIEMQVLAKAELKKRGAK